MNQRSRWSCPVWVLLVGGMCGAVLSCAPKMRSGLTHNDGGNDPAGAAGDAAGASAEAGEAGGSGESGAAGEARARESGDLSAPESVLHCDGVGQCELEFNTCCGADRMTVRSAMACNREHARDLLDILCVGNTEWCPIYEATHPDKNIMPMCVDSECRLVFVPEDSISSCTQDADCALHLSGCSSCGELDGTQTESIFMIALRRDKIALYEVEWCGLDKPCDDQPKSVKAPGSPRDPVNFVPICNPATHHCEVANMP